MPFACSRTTTLLLKATRARPPAMPRTLGSDFVFGAMCSIEREAVVHLLAVGQRHDMNRGFSAFARELRLRLVDRADSAPTLTKCMQ